MLGRHRELPRTLTLGADVASATAAAAGAYLLRFHAGVLPFEGDVIVGRYLAALPVAVPLMVAAALLAGGRGEQAARPTSVAEAVRVGSLATLLLATAALFAWKNFQYSRLAVPLAGGLQALLFPAGRAGARCLLARLRRGRGIPAVLVGGGRPAEAFASTLAAESWMTIEVVAALRLGDAMPAAFDGARMLGDLAAVSAFVGGGGAREVIVALPATEAAQLPAVLEALGDLTADIRVIPDLGGALLVNPGAAVISGLPVISLRERPLYGAAAALKRALDVALAGLLLVLLAPLLLVAALLIRTTSPGPAIFGQTRTGLDGREFRMLKFRTMRQDAEAATGPVFTTRDDPRTTGLGRFLRRFSLDELPQLWNVLRGEMSLVGPRPERGPFIEEFRRRFPGYMLRHAVRAGMTGWAQVHGLRGESSLEERLRYDLEYIDRWSLWLDLEILGRTAIHVLAGRNAY